MLDIDVLRSDRALPFNMHFAPEAQHFFVLIVFTDHGHIVEKQKIRILLCKVQKLKLFTLYPNKVVCPYMGI